MENRDVSKVMKDILKESSSAFENGVMNIGETLNNDEAMLEVIHTIQRKISEMKDIENGDAEIDPFVDAADFAYDYRCFLYLLTALLYDEYMHKTDRASKFSIYDEPLGGIMYWFIPDEDHLADGDDGLVHYISGLRR